jgi:hypothetical protein
MDDPSKLAQTVARAQGPTVAGVLLDTERCQGNSAVITGDLEI